MKQKSVCIEPASAADLPALVDLLSVLFTQEAEFTPDRQAQYRGLSHIISHAALGVVLVARGGSEVLGMVSLLYSVSTALGARVAWLEDWVVQPSARGTGVGSQLLQAAIAHARAEGCQRITLLTDSDNHAAQRMYQAWGFTQSSMVPMRLSL